MSTSRRHIKSRAGCFQCKQRKVKCDETLPSCHNCQRRGQSCSFLQHIPLASRPYRIISSLQSSHTPLSSLPLQFKTIDLELLHFYTTSTSHEILGEHITGTPIWRTSIVTLSFQHPFLLHALFSLSAIHLVYLYSTQNPALARKYTQFATLHHMKCLSTYRLEIQNLTSENSDACWACASVLALHAWAKPGSQGANLFFPTAEDKIPWYKLHRGGVEVLKYSFHWVEKGMLEDLIAPLMILDFDNIAPASDPDGDTDQLDAVARCWDSACVEERLALDDALSRLRHILSLIPQLLANDRNQAGPSISSCIATLSWTALVPQRFCDMVDERVPQALVVVAVYCVLVKRIEELWWVKGKGESLLGAVERELVDQQWDRWLDWPRKEIYGK